MTPEEIAAAQPGPLERLLHFRTDKDFVHLGLVAFQHADLFADAGQKLRERGSRLFLFRCGRF